MKLMFEAYVPPRRGRQKSAGFGKFLPPSPCKKTQKKGEGEEKKEEGEEKKRKGEEGEEREEGKKERKGKVF